MFNDPIAFTLFGLEIRWYALFIMTGVLVGAYLASRLAARRGLDASLIWDMVPIGLLAGVLGARLYFVALEWDYFRDNPGEIIGLRLAGLSIHGGLVAGVLAGIIYLRLKGQPILAWFDVLVPGLALGQAIGRWGNYANQEAFGQPTDLPWGIFIRPENRPAGLEQFSHFHPTFFYESVLNLLNAALLTWIVLRIGRSRLWRPGDAFGVYLITYGLIRLPIEWLRTDSLYIGPLPAAYWASALSILVGLAVLAATRTVWRYDPADSSSPAAGRGTRPTAGIEH